MSLSYNIYDGEKQRSATLNTKIKSLNTKIKELKNKEEDKKAAAELRKAAAELRTLQTMVVRKHRHRLPCVELS